MLRTLATVGTGLLTSAIFLIYVKPWIEEKQAQRPTGTTPADYHDMIDQLLNTDNQPMRSA